GIRRPRGSTLFPYTTLFRSGGGMRGHLKDRVEAEANRHVRERVERLRQAFEEALSAASEPMRFPLTPGEWGAASGAAQLHVIREDRKSTRLNSSHLGSSYAV